MLNFRTITLEDQSWVKKALQYSDFQGCEYCFANNLAWHRASNSKIASFQDFYIIAAFDTEDGIPTITVPSGQGDWSALLQALQETFCQSGMPLRFSGVTKKTAVWLQKWFPDAVWQPDRDAFDYIYQTADLIHLKGKKYHKKRNHLHRFYHQYAVQFTELTEADMDECIALSVDLYHQKNGYENHSSVVEQFAIYTYFTHFKELALCGGVLRADGKLVGFSIGEPLNQNTFVTHIEKADITYTGAYTALTQAFTEQFAGSYPYINREEDLGLEGLRQAKLSYYPAYLLEKGTITVYAI